MNKALKKAIKLLMIKLMTTLLPVIIILIILASALYFLTLDTAVYKEGSKSNVPYNASENYIKNVKFDENGIYFEATDKDGKTKKVTAEDIWNDLVDNKSDIAQYLDLPSEFEKLMNAEVVTQYPKIGVPEGKLDGIIEFERHKTDNTTQKLKYISLKKFNEMLENENIDIVNYFTLDEEENLLIGIVDVVTEEVTANTDVNIGEYSEGLGASDKSGDKYYKKTYTVTSKAVNYKNAVSKYTMPFQYLWSFLVVGDSKDFVLDLADLVNNSSITISIYDNITTTVNTDTTTYKREIKEETTTQEGNKSSSVSTSIHTDGKDYKVVHTTIYENNTPTIDLTKADVWMLDYSKTYKYQENADKSTSTNTSKVPDTEFKQFNTSTSTSEVKNKDGTTETKHTTTVYYERIIDKETNSKTEASTNKYVAGTPKINPKVDPDSEEPNFVTLLRDAKYKNVKDKVTGDSHSWLIEALEKNPDTVNMVDLTNYLLYKATGIDFGVTEYDFSAFNTDEFTEASSESASNLLVEYIHSWEHATPPPTSKNKKGEECYVVESDGYGNPTVGYGVDIKNSGYEKVFIKAGYNTSMGSLIPKDFVDGIEAEIVQKKVAEIKSKTSGLDLTEYQINALVSRAYNCGIAGAVGTRNGKTFVQAYKAYWNQKRDTKFKAKNADFNHKLYTQYMNLPNTAKGQFSRGLERRRKSEFRLFQTGYYDTLNKWHTEGGTIVESAKIIHDYMAKNKYTYCVYGGNSYEECKGGGHGLNTTFEKSKNGHHHSCCATFVSWVLQDAGYLSESEHLDGANPLQDLLKKKGFKRINNVNDLKAGDILCYDHHVEIYIGNGQIYNAGSGKAIRTVAPQNRTRSFSYALRAPK